MRSWNLGVLFSLAIGLLSVLLKQDWTVYNSAVLMCLFAIFLKIRD